MFTIQSAQLQCKLLQNLKMRNFMRNFNFFKTVLTVAFGFLLCLTAEAQTSNVSGKITAASDGLGIPGATVTVIGTTRGTISDMDGNYTFQAMQGETLTFSFIGMKTVEIAFNGQSTIDVLMEDDFVGLDEVVAIGYGSVKKEDLTGSVQAISAKDFNVGSISSPQELVNGKVSGVQIISDGGAPGAKQTIRIRGGASLSATNDPLIIIDGVPIAEGDMGGMRNPLNVINPNDIETFTVLKDASATAIYGSRASNGVIIITTKKGASGDLRVDYSGNVSVGTPSNYLDMLDATQYRKTLTERYPDDVGMMGSSDTDWQKEVYRTAISTDHSVALSGEISEVLPFRASIGYNLANGILDVTQMQRTTAAINLNPTFLEDHLKLNVSAKYMNIKNNFGDQAAIGDATRMDPTQSVRSNDPAYERFGGYTTWYIPADTTPNNNAPQNGRARLDQKRDISNVNRFIGNVQVDYKFHFLPELRANLNLGYDAAKGGDDGGVLSPANGAWDKEAFLRGGSEKKYNNSKTNRLLDFYLQYQREVDLHNFDLMGGYSYQHYWEDDNEREDFLTPDDEGSYVRKDYFETKTEFYLVSFFGRFNYNYDSRYFLTATVRQDGSSRFGPDNRWGLFPSVALTWNLKNESFLYDNNVLSSLKLRLSYGITGQQGIEGINYGYFGTYKQSRETAQYIYYDAEGQQKMLTIRPEGYDANLKWEETTTSNIAIDYGFLNNRIYGSLDLYTRDTKDLLNEINIPAGSNLSNRLFTNIGSMKNTGVEFSVNTLPVSNGTWKWEIGANVTYSTNEITKLTLNDEEDAFGVEVGEISGGTGNNIQVHRVGYSRSSFLVYQQVYDSSGQPIEGVYVDRNEDGKIDQDDKYIAGNPVPKYMLGINTKLSYKNWDFSLSGRANMDMMVYNNMASERGYYSGLRGSGFLNGLHTSALESNFYAPQLFSDYYVTNASFFRMDNISLGYNFQNVTFGEDNVRLRVAASVNNSFVVSNYKGLDPELENGIDKEIYPRPRTFVLGLTMSF